MIACVSFASIGMIEGALMNLGALFVAFLPRNGVFTLFLDFV